MRACLLLLATVLLCGRAEADEHVSEEAARGHFLAGKAYYAGAEYKRALVEFLAARGDLDRPELDYNIGLSYERLGDAGRALTAFERFASRYRSDDPALGEELQQRLAALRLRVGQLVISSHSSTTALTLDGDPLLSSERGRPIAMTAGEHVVSASGEGAYTRSVRVQILAGQTSKVVLDPEERAGKKRFPRWAIAVITVGSALVVGGIVTGAVLGSRAPSGELVVGNAAPGIVNVKP